MDIAIDFDGTCVAHEFPLVGKDIGAASVLKQLIANGHKLILNTMRSDKHDNTGFSAEIPVIHNGNFLTDAINWFKQNDIALYSINTNPQQKEWTTSPKCYAQLYIDDAALGIPLIYDQHNKPFVNWTEVHKQLIRLNIIKE
jgi:hypothetical protein